MGKGRGVKVKFDRAAFSRGVSDVLTLAPLRAALSDVFRALRPALRRKRIKQKGPSA